MYSSLKTYYIAGLGQWQKCYISTFMKYLFYNAKLKLNFTKTSNPQQKRNRIIRIYMKILFQLLSNFHVMFFYLLNDYC